MNVVHGEIRKISDNPKIYIAMIHGITAVGESVDVAIANAIVSWTLIFSNNSDMLNTPAPVAYHDKPFGSFKIGEIEFRIHRL